jgi:MFS family permease
MLRITRSCDDEAPERVDPSEVAQVSAGSDLNGSGISSAPEAGRLWCLSRRIGFWAVAASVVCVSAFSTAPSALYGLYAQRDNLSSLTVTIVYAVYAAGIVASLLLAGHISDWYGRRVVLIPALVVGAVASAVFLIWKSLPGLIVSRFLTGIAIGVTVATATAFLTDLDVKPKASGSRRASTVAVIANLGGLALGPLIAGLLARVSSEALTLPYIVFLCAIAASIAGVIFTPEGHPALRPLRRYAPQRLKVPSSRRAAFAAAIAGAFAGFAVSGLFVGLTGTFLSDLVHDSSPDLIGLTVFLTFGAGAVTQGITSTWPPHRLFRFGIVPILTGLALLVVSAWTTPPSLTLFLVSAAVAGTGAGAIFRASLATVVTGSDSNDRAGAAVTVYLAGYAGVSIPVIGVALVLEHLSPRVTLLIFGIAVAVGIIAAAPGLVRSHVGSSEDLVPVGGARP